VSLLLLFNQPAAPVAAVPCGGGGKSQEAGLYVPRDETLILLMLALTESDEE
jgi:hypothetical protein